MTGKSEGGKIKNIMDTTKDNSKIDTKDIHQEIVSLYKKNKYRWITSEFKINDLKRWAREQGIRLKINKDLFSERVSSLFWAISHVQLELGHMLIARQSITDLKEKNTLAYDEIDILQKTNPPRTNVPDLYFRHYKYLTTECLYRCWERMSLILSTVCFPNNAKKYYFNDLLNKTTDIDNLKHNPTFYKLKKLNKFWEKIAKERNNLSHFESSPMKEDSIEIKPICLESLLGAPKYQIIEPAVNPKKEIEKQYNRYLKIAEALKTVQEFIENVRPN